MEPPSSGALRVAAGAVLGNDPKFAIFTQPFSIDTSKLPLAPNLAADDPRKGLRWFPRPGDQWNIDAANPGFSGPDFTHGSGPVMRMLFALRDGEVSGLNIMPGGSRASRRSGRISATRRILPTRPGCGSPIRRIPHVSRLPTWWRARPGTKCTGRVCRREGDEYVKPPEAGGRKE